MPFDIPFENLNRFLYIDVLLGKSDQVTETITETAGDSQIYMTSFNNPDNTYAIAAVDQGNKQFDIAENVPSEFASTFVVAGSTGNDGTYTVFSAEWTGAVTRITVVEAIPSAVVDGTVAPARSNTRIIGQELFMYADDTKARRIIDFTYEPLQGYFFLNEDTPLASVYVEYYRYTSRQTIPVGNVTWEIPEPESVADIYDQPIFFNQPLFPRKITFDILHSDVELGKIFIRPSVLDREFFMVIDTNPQEVFSAASFATALKTGFAYEGPIQSDRVLSYFRGGPLTPPMSLYVHNFGSYYPKGSNWGGTGRNAITWRSNQPL